MLVYGTREFRAASVPELQLKRHQGAHSGECQVRGSRSRISSESASRSRSTQQQEQQQLVALAKVAAVPREGNTGGKAQQI